VIKIGFFEKINYRMIVNAFKQVCSRRRCEIFFVNVPVRLSSHHLLLH